MRRLHALLGLAAALPLFVIAATGALLSLQPALERAAYPAIRPGVNVAQLAESVSARHIRVDAIRVTRNGATTVTYNDGQGRQTEAIDPRSGASLGPYQNSALFRFIAELHRSLFLGDPGRIAVALAALALLALCGAGCALLAHSLGGVAKLFRPIRGDRVRRLHGETGRLALAGLMVSALSGVALAAMTFDLIPAQSIEAPAVPASGGPAAPIRALAGLAAVDATDLKSLKFPAPGDTESVFTLRSHAGEATVDPSTGAVLSFAATPPLARLEQATLALHGAHGLWAYAMLLGLCSAAAPLLGATGVMLWRRRRASSTPLQVDVAADVFDVMVFVGSETHSTWGFAKTLQSALAAKGFSVHAAAMNAVKPEHLRAKSWLVLTATYGDGDAPASAQNFLDKVALLEGRVPVAVLGFGDRHFPNFCGYAQRVAATLDAQGWPQLLPMRRIDRGSSQEFAQWARSLGETLGRQLNVEPRADRPATQEYQLIDRRIYGEAVGDTPRFYSLASSRRDGLLEICMRLRQGGLCSTFLHGLARGDRIKAFIRRNPAFRPAQGFAPLILIGAGIAPLAGFVRANDAGRPVRLYWGGRSPSSDFLYERALAQSLAANRLTALRTAFSQDPGERAYAQDRVAADAHSLRALIAQEAQILVCRGRGMADAVRETIEKIVRPLGLDLATLRAHGRRLEDVF